MLTGVRKITGCGKDSTSVDITGGAELREEPVDDVGAVDPRDIFKGGCVPKRPRVVCVFTLGPQHVYCDVPGNTKQISVSVLFRVDMLLTTCDKEASNGLIGNVVKVDPSSYLSAQETVDSRTNSFELTPTQRDRSLSRTGLLLSRLDECLYRLLVLGRWQCNLLGSWLLTELIVE